MRVEVDVPRARFGAVQGSLVRRRGAIVDSRITGDRVAIIARVPLAEMFDYASDLGSLTGGRGSHAMSLDRYEQVPDSIASALIERLKR